MLQTVNVHLLPTLTTRQQLAGKTVIVIDVLRASTTIVHALAAGALEIIPCLEVDEAREIARHSKLPTVLGGEREGLKIEGFDFGNSPQEYVPENVAGKRIVFTTTNGTRALLQCRSARRVVIGAFVNLSTVCSSVGDEPAIDLLCAGTSKEISREDVLLAGAIAEQLEQTRETDAVLNDQALLAVGAWRSIQEGRRGSAGLANALAMSRGARNLVAIGQQRDIEIAARTDQFEIVPELDLESWQIRAAIDRGG